MPPDPATPGLLDLLTVRPLGDLGPNVTDGEIGTPPIARGDRGRSAASHRLWVEVEV
jgi:hypothetical protein